MITCSRKSSKSKSVGSPVNNLVLSSNDTELVPIGEIKVFLVYEKRDFPGAMKHPFLARDVVEKLKIAQNKIDEITPEAEFDGSAERADNHKKQLLIKNTAILYCLENKIDIDNTRMKLEHISVYVRKDLKSANIKKFLLSVDRR